MPRINTGNFGDTSTTNFATNVLNSSMDILGTELPPTLGSVYYNFYDL